MSLLVHGARLVDADGVREDAWLYAADDAITEVGTGSGWRSYSTATVIDAAGGWVSPGFIDLHCHGAGGHRFEDPAADIAEAVGVHRRRGTTRLLLSLVTAGIDDLAASLARIATVAGADPLVLGSHLEGPYLSPERRGAHDPTKLREPDLDELDTLLAAAGGTLRQLTIAPELPGALDAIDHLVASDVVVAVGHTAADRETAQAAFDAGATLLTHAHNAMPGIGHRSPGPIVAAVDDPRVRLELINDGHHVDPRVVALTFAIAPGRVALISDSMAATGLGDGRYVIGALDVTVTDGVARVTDESTLAGSTLTLDVAVRKALAAGVDPADAVGAATLVPAAALGLDETMGRLAAGYVADLVVFDADWNVTRVFANGRDVV